MDKVKLNLPVKEDSSSSSKVKRYFNTYYEKALAYPANEVDAVIGFLESKGLIDQRHNQLVQYYYNNLKLTVSKYLNC